MPLRIFLLVAPPGTEGVGRAGSVEVLSGGVSFRNESKDHMKIQTITWLAALSAGCATDVQESTGERRQAVTESELAIDSPSPRPVMVRWLDPAPERQQIQQLKVGVENTTSETLSAQLSIAATDGELGTITAPFKEVELEPHSVLVVDVPLSRSPIKTNGTATSLVVTADFEVNIPEILEPQTPVLRSVQTSTEARLVTFGSHFERATVRTLKSQAAIESVMSRAIRAAAFQQTTRRVQRGQVTIDTRPRVRVSMMSPDCIA